MNIEEALRSWKIGGRKALAKTAVQAVGMTKEILSQPGTGRVYRRGGVVHQASVPGSPPAPDRGRLRASITWKPGPEGDAPWVEYGTNVGYAGYLEFGTSRMQARPFMRPVQARLRAMFPSLTVNEVSGEIRRTIRGQK